MTIKLTTGFLLALTILLFSFNSVSAEIIVPQESVNPPDGLPYLMKRIQEKIGLFFSFSNDNKIKNYKKLVTVRLSELKFIVEKKEMAYFEQTTLRYFSTAGQFTSFLINSNKKNEFTSVRDEFKSHIPVLENLRDNYDSTTAEWRFIQDDINYIKGYINSLSSE